MKVYLHGFTCYFSIIKTNILLPAFSYHKYFLYLRFIFSVFSVYDKVKEMRVRGTHSIKLN